MNSIRTKLLIALLGTAFFAMSIAATAVYLEVEDETNELFDYQLQQMAVVFLDTSNISFDHFTKKSKLEEIDNDSALIIYDTNHKKIYSTGIQIILPYPKTLGYKDQFIAGKLWHTYSSKNNKKTVMVLQPDEARQEIAASTALMAILPFLFILPVFGFVIWYIVRQGLLPLKKFEDSVSLLNEHSLEPLNFSSIPLELKPLADALNGMIIRLNLSVQERKNFVADAAHELRTPLAALLLQLELAQKASDSKEIQSALGVLEKGMHRANRLVEQLLMLVRQENSSDIIYGETNLTQVVSDILVALLPLAEAKNIQLEVAQMDQVSIQAQEYDIQTVVSNILDNAIRYTPQGGVVSISVYSQRDSIVLKISDNGIGIKKQDKERIFDRFYRVNNHNTIGSGLGLAIVKEICQKYAARLSVANNAPSGTVFTISFQMERS